jgi:hypothetical protein
MLAITKPAFAAPLYCSGRVNAVFTETSGLLYVLPTWRGDWMAICNVNSTYGGVTPELCRSWQAMALSALLAQKDTTTYYGDSALTCATLLTYSQTSAPAYFMVIK